MKKTTINIEKRLHRKLSIISVVTEKSVSEIIALLINSNAEYEKIVKVNGI